MNDPCFASTSDPKYQLQQEALAETSRGVMYPTLASAIPATKVSLPGVGVVVGPAGGSCT